MFARDRKLHQHHGRHSGRGNRRGRQGGMSLVEIMIVITIMALVMGAVGVAVFPALRRAKCKTAFGETQTIEQQVGMFRSDNNACPTSLNDLFTNKYLKKEPRDPWGKDYNFKCPGEKNPDTADIWSNGNDGQEGTPDDVKGWMRVEEQCK